MSSAHVRRRRPPAGRSSEPLRLSSLARAAIHGGVTTLDERLRAARERLAVGPVLARTFLRATGKDAKDYLHRMSTQDVNPLRPGESVYAAFLNAKGHLLADAHVVAQDDGVLWSSTRSPRPRRARCSRRS